MSIGVGDVVLFARALHQALESMPATASKATAAGNLKEGLSAVLKELDPGGAAPRESLLAVAERALLMEAAARHGVSQGAVVVGVGIRTMSGKLREYGFGPRETPQGAWPGDVAAVTRFLQGAR
ncbi:hypothetical protein Pan44_26510 [Caulifigura coniformis]|uniref:Uncharacterized protein n=1 Tax=Caulifigura coniformis TaxID=2527983 RepID=A0A517SEQ6_9PLAN|nr:hypothetical protein [Caulifigura coniformis]QDT54616.1 hypothetical protein Pan44_26510 [Caulifigura coniformis]